MRIEPVQWISRISNVDRNALIVVVQQQQPQQPQQQNIIIEM